MNYISIKLLNKEYMTMNYRSSDIQFLIWNCFLLSLLSYFIFSKVIITIVDWPQQYCKALKGELKGTKSLKSCLGHRRVDSLHHWLLGEEMLIIVPWADKAAILKQVRKLEKRKNVLQVHEIMGKECVVCPQTLMIPIWRIKKGTSCVCAHVHTHRAGKFGKSGLH